MHTHTHTPSSTRSRAQPFRPHQPTDTARTLGMVTALATAAHPTPTNTTSGVIARPTQGAPLARPSYSGHCERRLRPHLSQPCDPHFPLMPLVSHARDCHSPAPAGHLHSALSPLHTHLQPNTRATHPRTRSHGFSRRRCQQPSTPHRASRVRLPHGSPARTRRHSRRGLPLAPSNPWTRALGPSERRYQSSAGSPSSARAWRAHSAEPCRSTLNGSWRCRWC
jgi:hypothetical protein